jgi:hypothetical protein
MEVMVINVLNSTFETVTYVEQGVEILDAFMHLSSREVIINFKIYFIFSILLNFYMKKKIIDN